MDNKAIVLAAMEAFLIRKEESAVDRYWSPTYIQHSSGGLSGTTALKEFVRSLATMPGYSYQLLRTIADGDYVAVHGRYTGVMPQPVIVFDLFRLENGRLAEHWDGIQDEVTRTVSGRSMTDGPTQITELDQTEANKRLVKDFVETILLGGQFDRLSHYFESDHYLQHALGVGDGVANLRIALATGIERGVRLDYQRLNRLIGEGNFVFTQSEGVLGGQLTACYDLFRVENGTIAEHWNVMQASE